MFFLCLRQVALRCHQSAQEFIVYVGRQHPTRKSVANISLRNSKDDCSPTFIDRSDSLHMWMQQRRSRFSTAHYNNDDGRPENNYRK
jgi:hypothetical protein